VLELKSGFKSACKVSVGIESLKNGEEIKDVPANTTHVYILGNIENLIPPVVGQSFSTVKDGVISISSETDIKNLILFGGTPIASVGDMREVVIGIAPLLARIEIGKITCAGTSIKSFTLEGIFINNFYTDLHLDGRSNSLTNHGTDADKYLPPYVIGMFDYRKGGMNRAEASLITPNEGEVWGYNVFAPLTFPGADKTTPHIVLRLKNIVTADDSDYSFPNNPWFVTIKGFRNAAGIITKLHRSNVYRINEIHFTEVNIMAEPEMQAMDVEVEVSIIDWTSETMTIIPKEYEYKDSNIDL
jgi:hypothetical protein